MTQIVPAILAPDELIFTEQLQQIQSHCNLIQIDVLDNTLFPHENWFDAKAVGATDPQVEIELHLMVENPIPIIETWQEHVPAFKRAIVHAEMHRPLGSVVGHIKDVLKLEVGIAINPETPLEAIEDVIHTINQLTIMSVHPGKQGQAFGDEDHMGDKEAIYAKIKQAKQHRPDLTIEIDGGLREEFIKPLINAGVERLCAGSLIFGTENPQQQLIHLKNLIESYEN